MSDRLDAALLTLAGPLLVGGLLVTSASALALTSSPLSPPAQEWVLVLEAERAALFATFTAASASALAGAAGTAEATSAFAKGALAAAAASPSLLLVVGGIATLGVSFGLLALTSAPAPEPAAATTNPRRRPEAAPPAAPDVPAALDEAYERGRRAGATAGREDLDATLDLLVENAFGTPRVLRSTSTLVLVALDDCRGCRDGAPRKDGCSFERGFLEGALAIALGSATVAHEPRCRGRGDARCEFEVWHA